MNFNVTKIRPKGFAHSSAFNEVISQLTWSLSSLGHAANETENWIDATDPNIIFGAELLAANQPKALPLGTIIYNLEQPTHPGFQRAQSIAIGSKCTVWDYSQSNINRWRDVGIYARHVPIGHTPNLTRINSILPQDIDVLFLGWLTPRRLAIINQLKESGLTVVTSDKCYGGGRDNLIARSKICLNIHHDGRNLFEIVRCSYLMANYKTIVTERSEDDAEYSDLDTGLIRCDYDDVLQTVQETLKKMEHAASGWHAHEAISRRNFTETVKAALSDPDPKDKVRRRYEAAREAGDMKDFAPWLMEHAKGTILEIGVRDGASTSALLRGVEQNGGVVCSVDIADCSSLFSGHPQWKFICADSHNQKLHVPELDMLLIDGDHTRDGYRADLERFYPLVKPGGLILSHDINVPEEMTLESTGQLDRPSKYIREEYLSFCAKHALQHEELPGFAGMGVITNRQLDYSEFCSSSDMQCFAIYNGDNSLIKGARCLLNAGHNGDHETEGVVAMISIPGEPPKVIPSHGRFIWTQEVIDSDESWQASEALSTQ